MQPFPEQKNFAAADVVTAVERQIVVADLNAGLCQIVGVNGLAQPGSASEDREETKHPDDASDVIYRAVTELSAIDQGWTQGGPADPQSRAGLGESLFAFMHVADHFDIDGIG